MIPERIVAEVSRTWSAFAPRQRLVPISTDFEKVIERNRSLGFDLESWRFQVATPDAATFTETILAVFVRRAGGDEEADHGNAR